jgi:uncharacterized protein YqfB (UPF0267 family)
MAIANTQQIHTLQEAIDLISLRKVVKQPNPQKDIYVVDSQEYDVSGLIKLAYGLKR